MSYIQSEPARAWGSEILPKPFFVSGLAMGEKERGAMGNIKAVSRRRPVTGSRGTARHTRRWWRQALAGDSLAILGRAPVGTRRRAGYLVCDLTTHRLWHATEHACRTYARSVAARRALEREP